MQARFDALPQALRRAASLKRLGDDVPALVARPETDAPAPTVIWMHGRTVYKELDAGRYLRWIRAGIGAVALDLPGHGERLDREWHGAARTLDTVEQMAREIDGVLEEVSNLPWVDANRIAIGGMSAGGMATLRRLCDPHPFVAAAVEGTCGDLEALYLPAPGHPDPPATHEPERVRALSPRGRLDGWRPIPVLALHNELDEMIPLGAQQGFIEALRDHYRASSADPDAIELVTYGPTGAPAEHAGFGRHATDAKNRQLAFLERVLGIAVEHAPDSGE